MTDRYARQIFLPEIGATGQALLGKARVLVVGAGGLGSPALLYLTAAGVGLAELGGQIGIIDDDTVDASNLQRQILFRENDQKASKAEAARHHLSALNGATQFVVYPHRLNAANALDILGDYDIIIDGSDNFGTKYMINDAAVKLGKPVVYGSILGFEGQASVFSALRGPCYRCLYPQEAQSHIPNCAEAGTIGSIAGVIGSIQALEACKLALGEKHCEKYGLETLIGKLMILDARNWDTRILTLDKNPDCALCQQTPEDIVLESTNEPACKIVRIPTISLSDLDDLYQTGAPVMLVDVREASEWASGHLSGAVHIPLAQLLTVDDDSDLFDRDCLIIVYCQHGIRSMQAAHHLSDLGFNTLNLRVSL